MISFKTGLKSTKILLCFWPVVTFYSLANKQKEQIATDFVCAVHSIIEKYHFARLRRIPCVDYRSAFWVD
jgi:hypothetical protein